MSAPLGTRGPIAEEHETPPVHVIVAQLPGQTPFFPVDDTGRLPCWALRGNAEAAADELRHFGLFERLSVVPTWAAGVGEILCEAHPDVEPAELAMRAYVVEASTFDAEEALAVSRGLALRLAENLVGRFEAAP